MKPGVIEPDFGNDKTERLRRVYRYLRDNPGPLPREQIMHWTGFPSPRDQPICAYVEFANAVMRLDAILRRHGREVFRGNNETYWIFGGAA